VLTVRPRRETIDVTISSAACSLGLVAATHAWLASGLFGLLFVLRFALQPADGARLNARRRALLALLGCSSLGCLIWAVGVRIAGWPG
jgi:hypothetical protein